MNEYQRIHSPFEDSAAQRLRRMGLTTEDGSPERDAMSVFATIFAASFFDDLCDTCEALESPNEDGRFHYTDGNHGEIITWPSNEHPNLRSYSLTGFNHGRSPHHLEIWTHYPENVPYTGNSVEA